ncbi:hypothetical protein LTR53_016132 [Teratosphaeriaceae sp. CCFEE 6253]|nr:hypothetical protein LTR53_016132 [Teratosphaeriaceae sp. CCFEE 6253]
MSDITVIQLVHTQLPSRSRVGPRLIASAPREKHAKLRLHRFRSTTRSPGIGSAEMGPSRRQQTRLTFTPLSSSSPADHGYPQQMQDRAAAVGYAGSSPAKRRKPSPPDVDIRNGRFGGDGADDLLPTPAATMTLRGDRVSSEEESSSKRTSKRRGRSRQQALDFTGARESTSFSSPVRLHSSPKPQTQAAGMFSSGTRRSRRQQHVVEVSSDNSGNDEEQSTVEAATTTKFAARPRGSQRLVIVDSDDEAASDVVVASARKRRARVASERSGTDDDMPTTQGKLPRKRKRQRSRDSFVSSSPPRAIVSEDDSDLEIIEKPTRKRARQDTDEDDDEGTGVTPGRRGLKPARKLSRQEQADLDDDLEFLGPSSDVEALERQPRSTQDRQKLARQSALEKLKRKRSGQPQIIEEEPELESNGASGSANEDATPVVTSSRQMSRVEEEDDAFIDSDVDGDDTLGAPDAAMPLAFTRQASSKPKELFKHAVEWFVQRKINPGFNMHDELYELTFRKLDDEVQGLAGSKFKSAAWTPAFTAAITGRPEIAIEALDRHSDEHYLNDKCDACNRSGHPATFQIQFQGRPYHPQTLEEVSRRHEEDEGEDDNSSSSEGDNDDQPAYGHRGTQIPAMNTIYYVGKFCKANAETAHELQHWRYHLNEYAILWMTRQGYLTADKIVKRDQMSVRKRQKEALKITDHMERGGEIKALWGAYRQKIDEARSSKQGRFAAGA